MARLAKKRAQELKQLEKNQLEPNISAEQYPAGLRSDDRIYPKLYVPHPDPSLLPPRSHGLLLG